MKLLPVSCIIFVMVILGSCHSSKRSINTMTLLPDYKPMVFKSSTIDLPYNILRPNNIDGEIPLVIFLHGAGERGNDNEIQLVHGSKIFRDSMDKYPAIYLFPQCPLDGYWANVDIERGVTPLRLNFSMDNPPTQALSAVMELIDLVMSEYPIDKSKVNVMGLSMGGMGTFELLYRRPDLYRSAIAICGGGNPDYTKSYPKDTRLWIAHGLSDGVVNPIESETMYQAAIDQGLKVKYTTYPNVGHNSWDNVFADPNYLSWLFD